MSKLGNPELILPEAVRSTWSDQRTTKLGGGRSRTVRPHRASHSSIA
jgi:hypothetical protein